MVSCGTIILQELNKPLNSYKLKSKMKKSFNHKIKEGAFIKMVRILKYPETGSAIIDNALCCITDVVSANSYILKNISENLKDQNLYQIRILNSKVDAEAFILPEFLEEIPEEQWIIDKE